MYISPRTCQLMSQAGSDGPGAGTSCAHLGTNVMVHRVDDIIQEVDVQLLTEVQQLSGWVIRQHCHFCWHRASEGGEAI